MPRVCSLEKQINKNNFVILRPFFLTLATSWLGLIVSPCLAGQYDFQSSEIAHSRLTIYGSMDIAVARPLILKYQSMAKKVSIQYHELDSVELYARFVEEVEQNRPVADILLSPAMDLQVKLANDGYIRQYQSPELKNLPRWSMWRNEVFGFSVEPAVVVYNKDLLPAEKVPRTRGDLLELLSSDSELLFGRIATYDIERSGLGFLFLAQDVQRSKEMWNLVGVMGSNSVKLYTNTSAMLDHISSGKFILGYNLLGSYARERSLKDPGIEVILPQDYTLAILRTAVLPKQSREPELAEHFLDFLLSKLGQDIVVNDAGLYGVYSKVNGDFKSVSSNDTDPRLVPIDIGPELIVYVDHVKRKRFLRRWQETLSTQ